MFGLSLADLSERLPVCHRRAKWVALALALAVGASLPAHAAAPEGRALHVRVQDRHHRLRPQPQRYAIEFRARYALSYGHVFVMYGPLDRKGDFVTRTVAGLHPAGDSPTPWMIGHILPVQAETGPSDGDLDDRYMSARFRIDLDPAEYARVVEYIKDLQRRSPVWHVLFNSCITFVSDIGRFMGLVIPNDGVLYPQDFINKMKDLNMNRERRDAPSRQDHSA
jgi:hypothetical protein